MEKSCDHLPTCLMLLDENKRVIGHSRLSQMRGRENACLVESGRFGSFFYSTLEQHGDITCVLITIRSF